MEQIRYFKLIDNDRVLEYYRVHPDGRYDWWNEKTKSTEWISTIAQWCDKLGVVAAKFRTLKVQEISKLEVLVMLGEGAVNEESRK